MTGIPRPFWLLPFAVMLALCLCPAGAWALVTSATLVESKLGGGTILNSPADKLISTVQDCVKQYPQRSAAIVTAVLKGGRTDTDAIAPQVTVAAIEGLGPDPSSVIVSQIVFSSVKATPAVVLETVKAAVKAAPGCAKAIVRAAVKAVPNPNDKVEPVGELVSPSADGYSKDDSKDGPEPDATSTAQPMPVGEAIAQAAHEGDPSLSYQELLTTANEAASEHTGGGDPSISTYPGYYYPPLVSVKAVIPDPAVVSK